MSKYEFTDETKIFHGRTLHRIRALQDFGLFLARDLGGWVEKEENLSQTGNAWVDDNACVFGDARVNGDACVFGDVLVCGDALVNGSVWGKTPFYIQGSKFAFIVANDRYVRCGCQIHTWREWHDHYMEIALKHGSEDIVPEYVRYFNLACRMYGHEDCLIETTDKKDKPCEST